MVAVAIFSADTALGRSFEKLLRDEQSAAFLGAVDHTTALSKLAEKHGIDVILVHGSLIAQFADWRAAGNKTAWIAIFDDLDEERGLRAIKLGASAILQFPINGKEVVGAIQACGTKLIALQRQLAEALFSANSQNGHLRTRNDETAPLTPRELEVLNAMADGAPNKAIARRLGISVHTVKFHIAAILEKLDAETRTEAVIKAAQLGMLML
jgi:two-component system, NarL family, response regulator YdfI